jgi:hypothetical protein
MAGTENDDWTLEWTRVRDLIETCDERIQDMRKYGFTFLSGLLTAETLLGFKFKEATAGSLPPVAGLGLFLIAVCTLFGIRISEKQCQMLQTAAAIRAHALENWRPIELTGSISDRYRRDNWPRWRFILYLAFGGTAGITSAFLTQFGSGRLSGYYCAAYVAISLAYLVGLIVLARMDVETRRLGDDWGIDKTECAVGERVTVLVSNLTEDSVPIPTPAFKIYRMSANGTAEEPAGTFSLPPSEAFKVTTAGTSQSGLPELQSYAWTWIPRHEGIYRIELLPPSTGGSTMSLRRKVRVHVKDPTAPKDLHSSKEHAGNETG